MANKGENNGNAHKIFVKKISTDETIQFGSSVEVDKYFNELGIDGCRFALKNLKEVERFGFQTVLFNDYIFFKHKTVFRLYICFV